jgi:Fur family ferric uptake transcriptional regulator
MLGKENLKEVGLKVTIPRLKILEILETSKKKHMSAEQIYKVLLANHQEVGLATVYRVLTQFEQLKMVRRLNFEDNQAVFELVDEHHHDHLICVKCGNIEEFVDEVIEMHQENIAKKYGYKLTDHDLCLYGICANCF